MPVSLEFVRTRVRLPQCIRADDVSAHAEGELAAEMPGALGEIGDVAPDGGEVLLVFPIIGHIIHKPKVTMLGDNVLARVGPACGVDRRMRHAHRLHRQGGVVGLEEFTAECEMILRPEAFEHLDEFVHAVVAGL